MVLYVYQFCISPILIKCKNCIVKKQNENNNIIKILLMAFIVLILLKMSIKKFVKTDFKNISTFHEKLHC